MSTRVATTVAIESRCSQSLRKIALAALNGACVVDPLTTKPVSAPAWYANNVEGYVQTASGEPPDRIYGWDLDVAAGRARWKECTAIDVCGAIERERPASDLLAFEHVGRAHAGDAGDVDVLALSLTPAPKYVVPVKDPVPPARPR